LNIIGIILGLFGTVWILQGLNIFTQGGFMVGNRRWAVIGAVVLAIGLTILVTTNRRKSA